jgi:DNA (cytosine-5)-methyltransferase 1
VRTLRVAGLFAGVGGIELGLEQAGHHAEFLCEIDPFAGAVLTQRFRDVPLHHDVTTLRSLPTVDLVTAGFPCQDISLAGTRTGLAGARSGLVGTVFELIGRRPRPPLVLLENVQNLLRLDRGRHLDLILDEFERLRYRWAYRLVDTRGFGLPQRRQRVILLASRCDVDPAAVLFSKAKRPGVVDRIGPMEPGRQYGFYWTEGRRGVGWAVDAVPTIKAGSGFSIPSPPAIFDAESGWASTPDITDAERLQGFRANWTRIAIDGKPVREGHRWRMVGNAVSVPVSRWIGRELREHPQFDRSLLTDSWDPSAVRPPAACSRGRRRYAVRTTPFVERSIHRPIGKFLKAETSSLSTRALLGYVSRAREGSKRFPPGFIEALELQAFAS